MLKVLTQDYESYRKGMVGEVVGDLPWENKNPTLLQFGNEIRDVFPDVILKDVGDDTKLSKPQDAMLSARRGEPHKDAVSLLKLDRMFRVLMFLYNSKTEWHSTPDLFDVAEIPRTYCHVIYSTNHGGTSLESLELIERDPMTERPIFWRITKKGIEQGVQILMGLHHAAEEVIKSHVFS